MAELCKFQWSYRTVNESHPVQEQRKLISNVGEIESYGTNYFTKFEINFPTPSAMNKN